MKVYVVAKGVMIYGAYSTAEQAFDQMPEGVRLESCPNPDAGWNDRMGSMWRIRVVELDRLSTQSDESVPDPRAETPTDG